MEYESALEWVHGLQRLASVTKENALPKPKEKSVKQSSTADAPELQCMRNLLAALGNPQRRLRFVHFAGTNGKGSTLMMLASILREAGYKTGVNSSPYLLDFRERFLINGEMIEKEALAAILTQVRRAAKTLARMPIEFEAVTAAALLYFEQQQCDIVCLEAGIGGRLDSTNVVENTLVACITQIGYDHTEILGETLVEIAAEKCGIIKKRCPVICYPVQPKEAAAEILLQAGRAGSVLTVPAQEDFHFYKERQEQAPLHNHIYYGGYELEVPFLGRHQALNASVALEGALELWRQGFTIEDEHIIEGIAKARFPGRIEVLGYKPLVILDGAHNVDSAKALARTLCAAKLAGMTAVVGVLQDKEADDILCQLAPYITTLFAVSPDTPRALPAHELAQKASKLLPDSHACASVAAALRLARRQPGRGILVFGSLYLAAQARPLLMGGMS